MRFSDNVLSRNQMKSVKGGFEGGSEGCIMGPCLGNSDCTGGCKCSSSDPKVFGTCG